MLVDDRLLDTVEAVHAAGVDGALWPDALEAIRRLFGAAGATLENFEKASMTLLDLRIVGLPPHAETDYLAHYARHNPRAAYAFRNLSKVTLCDYEFIDERTMNRDAYYEKYLRSLDLRYFLSGQIANTPRSQAIVSIQRSRRQGHVERIEVERMQRLLPHLRQAFDLSTRLRDARRHARSLEDALRWLSDGVAVVAADGRIVHANEAFRDMVRRDDGIRVGKGRLEFAAPAANGRLAAALAAAGRALAGDPAAAGDFQVPRAAKTPPYLVSVRLLPQGADDLSVNGEGMALVFIHDPALRNPSTVAALRDALGLTAAEAALAQALQAGVMPVDYARDRGLSLNTVYTHLRRIKEKCGARRTPELVRKLGELQGPLRAGAIGTPRSPA